MDEIYNDLENYDEVNANAELRSENQELKTKIEEKDILMDKMQKDFDKLSSEFKNLVNNYSSLLKTARAEIERKTQIITNINIEKDVLICKMLQSGDKNMLDCIKEITHKRSKFVKNDQSSVNKVKTKKSQEKPDCDSENERNDGGSVVSLGHQLDNTNLDSEQSLKNACKTNSTYDTYSGKDSEDKKSMCQDGVRDNNTKPKPLSIRNRRKSMPVVSKQDLKDSSDEDYYNPDEHIKEYPMKDNADRNNPHNHYSNHYTNRILNFSSKDDKSFGYYESSRDIYKNRNNRHYDNDNYRNRDTYEYSYRYRRDFSPDRHKRRLPRDHCSDTNQRLEHSRGRILESPPKGKYNYSHSQRYTIHRSNNPRIQKNEQNRYKHHQDRCTVKHRMASDHDESSNKRKKKDPYDNHEDTNWYEREDIEEQTITDTIEQLDLQYTSCQSPDYVYTDMTAPIREIMNIALMQLEDPRLSSKKYSLKPCGEKTILSTVNDTNIALKLIDKSIWGLAKVSVPAALLYQPKDGETKHIYSLPMSNPVLSMSSDSSELSYQQNVTGEDSSMVKLKPQPSNVYPVNDYKKLLSQGKLDNNVQEVEEKPRKVIHDLPLPKIPCDKSKFINTEHSNVIKKSQEFSNSCKSQEDRTVGSERKSPTGNDSRPCNLNTNKTNITCHDSKQVFNDTSYLSTKQVVEGDLELSDDETCDTDLLKIDVKCSSNSKTPQDSCTSQGIDMKCNVQQQNNPKEKTCIETNSHNSKHHIVEKSRKERKVTKEKSKKTDTLEKVKSKKKLQRLKDEENMNTTEKVEKNNVTDKKVKRKKEKEKSKEPKTKFKDLFGESNGSSLITPDDLGIVADGPVKQSYYTTIFEDAQDTAELKETNFDIETSRSAQTIDVTIDIIPKTDATVTAQGNDLKPFVKNNEGSNEKADVTLTDVNNFTANLNMIYANLEPLTKETEDVKTVIISTGCQQEVFTEEHVKNDPNPTNENNTLKTPETNVDASPTSLHKETTQPDPFEIKSKLPDLSCNSNDSQFSNNITNSDTLDSQNITDVPDVRIFLRRKRRFSKKPPVT